LFFGAGEQAADSSKHPDNTVTNSPAPKNTNFFQTENGMSGSFPLFV
jgi:hypothetical protein